VFLSNSFNGTQLPATELTQGRLKAKAALDGVVSEAKVNKGPLEAKATLSGFVSEGVLRRHQTGLNGFLSVPTPNGAGPGAVVVFPLELSLGSDGRRDSRPKKDVGGFQSDTDAGVSMSPPKGDIGVLPLSADLQVSVSKDGAAVF
jgi:hypothetical protein